MAEAHTLTVAEIVHETADACSVVFSVPPESAEAFRYSPGQFLTLRVPSDRTGSVARCYSLSSAPHEGRVQVTVKRTADGYGSNWICDHLRAGSKVEVLPPAGVFTPSSFDEDLLLLAGGSGITPVMSILKTALEKGTGQVVLVYANRGQDSVIFADELASLAARHPDRLVVVHWLETVQGIPSVAQLGALLRPHAGREAFLCGPAPFMTAAKQALTELGAPRKRVHLERFVSLGGNPFEVASAAAPSTEDTGSAGLTVELDGDTHSLDWPRQRKLLDFLLDSGIDAPFSCREGQCSACACRITSGEVKMLNNEVLDSEDLADGIVLACQSLPLTDEVSVTYE
ncbi:ferredoxin--NADP reductase [Amycolatopsis sp. CA-230715]|uniref:ferredoxin--NADP reductase n=1 Tax=Amycolatopsis sp. CA-230715 TaxID=2745196 RepID=UPI001C026441|nr:ferredoxin--NADP reductase [Amycolatopsis sp. CA-230715]QWF76907.1 3-ketosteroid-9-alpha-monooxygenase, ferredoxin reductase component [Amycolatopsis sp. CA-230715]